MLSEQRNFKPATNANKAPTLKWLYSLIAFFAYWIFKSLASHILMWQFRRLAAIMKMVLHASAILRFSSI